MLEKRLRNKVREIIRKVSKANPNSYITVDFDMHVGKYSCSVEIHKDKQSVRIYISDSELLSESFEHINGLIGYCNATFKGNAKYKPIKLY